MNKREVTVGQRFGKLTVITQDGTDRRGNQLVEVECDCWERNRKTVRFSDLTFEPFADNAGKLRKPRRSCGCSAKKAYVDYLDRRALGLGRNAMRKIWKMYQEGLKFEHLAKRFNLPEDVISAVCRIYKPSKYRSLPKAITKQSRAIREQPNLSVDDLPF
jgi:hypothetical protein